MHLVPQALTFAKFIKDPPVIFGPVSTMSSTGLLSLPYSAANTTSTIDVVDSLNVFSAGALCTILAWLLVSCAFLIASTKHVLKTTNIRWNIIRAILFQGDFSFVAWKQRIVSLIIVVGLFFIKNYYDGNFKTDLTLKMPEARIDTLSDLLQSNRWPVFINGDTSAVYIERAVDHDAMQVASIYRERRRKGQMSVATTTVKSISDMLTAIRKSESVLICIEPAEIMFRSIDCFSQGNYKPSSEQLYTSKSRFNDEMRAFVYNPNISIELRSRLDKRLMRVYEMYFMTKELAELDESIAETLSIPFNWKYMSCIKPDFHKDQHSEVISLKIDNMVGLITIAAIIFGFALFIFSVEYIFRAFSIPQRNKMLRELHILINRK